MTVTEQKIQQGVVAKIEGRMDGVTSQEIQRHLIELLQEKNKLLVLDLKEVNYISSAGMRTFLVLYKRAKETSNKVYIIQMSAATRELLEMTGFLSFIPNYDDLETALKNYTP